MGKLTKYVRGFGDVRKCKVDFSGYDWKKLLFGLRRVFGGGANRLRGLEDVYARSCSPGIS